MSSTLEYGPLRSDDVAVVWPWLRVHLRWHLRRWADALDLGWTDQDVERRIVDGRLVEREWSELLANADADDAFVQVARLSGVAAGCVYAEARHDRYVGQDLGVLSWIYVAEAHRGLGIGGALVGHALDWMRDRGLTASEVFVTGGNDAAIGAYESGGYKIVDHRMLTGLGD